MNVPLLPIHGGHLDLIRGQAHVRGELTALTSTEVAVLSVLADAMPDPASEEELLRKAWGYKATKTRTVSVAMSRLRAKLERDPRTPQVVVTVRGQGYRLVAEAERLSSEAPAAPPVAGRTREQAAIAEHLAAGRAVELVGPGGVGTSTLARAACPTARWVELAGVRSREGLLRRLCDAFQLEGPEGEQLVAQALRSEGAVVLDHGHDLDPDSVELLGRLLPEARGPVVLTSRRPLDLGARVMVGALDDESSLQVLQQARSDAGLAPLDPAQATPVIREAGGFPLGLVLAAPLAELAGDGVTLGLASDPEGALVKVLRETLSLCEDDDLTLLALASAFAVAADLPALVDLAGQPRTEVLRLLHRLRQRGLVQLAHGRVQVPAAVAAVACTPEARTAHARWASTLTGDPMVLRPLRSELEAAIAFADADTLAHLLMRHLIVLHVYGPRDRVDEEIVGLLHRIPSPGRRHVLLGAALQSGTEHQAALESYSKAIDELPEDDVEFLGWAWLQLSVLGSWLQGTTDTTRTAEPMLALRHQVSDLALRCSLTINAASMVTTLDSDRAMALFREVDPHAKAAPSLALLAAFHRLFLDTPTAADVRWVEKQLDAVGKERLGPFRWHAHQLRVGAAWLRHGDDDRAFAYFDVHMDPTWRLDPRAASNTIALAAAAQLHRPELARRVFALLPERRGPVPTTVGWYLDGAEGEPPTEDDTLEAIWKTVVAGHIIEPSRPWLGLTRALQHMQSEGSRPPRRDDP